VKYEAILSNTRHYDRSESSKHSLGSTYVTPKISAQYLSELLLIVTKRCQIAMRLSAFSLLQMTSQEQCDRLRTDTHGTLRCVLFERWPCFRKEQYESGTWSSIAQKGFHCISGGGLVSRSSFEGDPEHNSGQEAPFYTCRKHKW